jgi:hypothetical protein
MELSNRSGVATPGAIGVVILKVWVWAEALVARLATQTAMAMPIRKCRRNVISTAPGVGKGKTH